MACIELIFFLRNSCHHYKAGVFYTKMGIFHLVLENKSSGNILQCPPPPTPLSNLCTWHPWARGRGEVDEAAEAPERAVHLARVTQQVFGGAWVR